MSKVGINSVMKVLICFALISASAGIPCPKAVPQWPEAFELKSTLNVPEGEIREPIQVWFDSQIGNTRIDYFGGASKLITMTNDPEGSGSLFIIKPIITEKNVNKDICLHSVGKIEQEPILPDLSFYECEGSEYVEEKLAQKWTKTNEFEDGRTTKNTMWIEWKNMGKRGTRPVPLLFQTTGDEHYFITYHEYHEVKPEQVIWKHHEELLCQKNRTNSDEEAEFNPLREYIHGHDDHILSHYERFKNAHNRKNIDTSEHKIRRSIFKRNYRIVHSHNRAAHSYKLALNQFADFTDDELKSYRGRLRTMGNNGALPFPYDDEQISELSLSLPLNLDWRRRGAVTRVKNQLDCGSCYSFGATGAIEGAYFLKTGKLITLSEQALVDCSWGYGNLGCEGGLDYASFEWVMQQGGLPLEKDYPYRAIETRCHFNETNLYASITGFVYVPPYNKEALKIAVHKYGPVTVAIDSHEVKMSLYSHGIFYDKGCKIDSSDHQVLVVGYGTINGQEYWLIKNSYGKKWGDDGYIMISAKNHNCGVTMEPSYVIM